VLSASRPIVHACLLAVCGLVLVATLAGCTTTQETAALKQAQSKRILKRREHKRNHDKADRTRSQKR
jgi:hypothetical protein